MKYAIVCDTINIEHPKFKLEEMEAGLMPFKLFDSKEEANQYVIDSLNIATELLHKTKELLTAVLKENHCELGFTMEGDTHGIYESHLDLVTKVNDVYFYLTIEY
jgi:hypothetical protein